LILDIVVFNVEYTPTNFRYSWGIFKGFNWGTSELLCKQDA